jgi:DNA-binding MarR family transcriptional regulator
MLKRKKYDMPDTVTVALFTGFQKLFRCMDFGRGLQGRVPVLTVRQMQVLSFFNESEVVYISDVSRKLNMSIQSVNNLVKRLEVMGYVERTQNEHDKRLSDIRFTQKGREGFQMFRAVQLGFLQEMLQQLSDSERCMVLKSVEGAAELFQKAVMSLAGKSTGQFNKGRAG